MIHLYESYFEDFIEYLKSSSDYCYTSELSDVFELTHPMTLSILPELKNIGCVEFEDISDGRWWAV